MSERGAAIRIGVLGCGRIGRWHAELIAKRVPGLALTWAFVLRLEYSEDVE
jgi:predicted dehydrogenase